MSVRQYTTCARESSFHRWILFRKAAAFKMSSCIEAINHLAREGFDLLGTSDGSALCGGIPIAGMTRIIMNTIMHVQNKNLDSCDDGNLTVH